MKILKNKNTLLAILITAAATFALTFVGLKYSKGLRSEAESRQVHAGAPEDQDR